MNLSIPVSAYNTDTTLASGITTSTNVRDVSEMLEMWAHKETPFLNRISWGQESGGLIIEWLTEHLGWRYVETSAALATGGTAILIASGVGGLSRAEQMKQIKVGTMLFAKGADGSESADHAWMVVSTIGASYSLTVAFMASCTASIAASTKLYIVSSFANEGSEPDRDTSRKRTLLSNKMGILRQDIRITGSMVATDMHAVANELQHQTRQRLLEMQFERERSIFFSRAQSRSGTVYGSFKGLMELFVDNITQTSWVDNSTTTLGETAFNNIVAELFENGGRPNVVVGPVAQIRKFTGWATDRIRSTMDTRVGGQYITQYLTDTGLTLDLVPMVKFPAHLLFILDTSKIELRAKKGRKLIVEKLAKVGDYDTWQMISEYSLEHHGFAWGQHGAFMALT
jgi:Family of unknown function (DUF5309)